MNLSNKTPHTNADPDFSPDGSQDSLSCHVVTGNNEIYIMNADCCGPDDPLQQNAGHTMQIRSSARMAARSLFVSDRVAIMRFTSER
jgi:hypothetical protein